ncbi:hypothetical protein BVRB_8g191200 [Beta vulgaris subsp. vulgaris]|nr:hypothetical protein BVRB_8g191200 [Beta vulgaris subsp. vulgaris]
MKLDLYLVTKTERIRNWFWTFDFYYSNWGMKVRANILEKLLFTLDF